MRSKPHLLGKVIHESYNLTSVPCDYFNCVFCALSLNGMCPVSTRVIKNYFIIHIDNARCILNFSIIRALIRENIQERELTIYMYKKAFWAKHTYIFSSFTLNKSCFKLR